MGIEIMQGLIFFERNGSYHPLATDITFKIKKPFWQRLKERLTKFKPRQKFTFKATGNFEQLKNYFWKTRTEARIERLVQKI